MKDIGRTHFFKINILKSALVKGLEGVEVGGIKPKIVCAQTKQKKCGGCNCFVRFLQHNYLIYVTRETLQPCANNTYH